MIKRILAILLLSVFTLTAVGVEVKRLYCDGKLSEVGPKAKPCCKLNSCCQVETDFYTLTDSFEASDFSFEFQSLLTAFVYYPAFILVLDAAPVASLKPADYPPDEGRLYTNIPIRILYCSYQI